MLLIAIPKSASTSLMKLIDKEHDIPALQKFYQKRKKMKGVGFLQELHSDIREIDEEDVKNFKRKDVFYKQHIFPSANNIKKLKKVKKVILLREPQDIIEAYYRAHERGIKGKGKMNHHFKNKEHWIKISKAKGLQKDIQLFHDRWLKEAKHDKNSIIIYYKDVLGKPKETLNKIEKHFGLKKTTKEVTLPKWWYTRQSKTSVFFKIVLRREISKAITKLHLQNILFKLKNKHRKN